MNRLFMLVLYLVLVGCQKDNAKSGLVQEKETKHYLMRLEYLPEDTTEQLHFLFTIQLREHVEATDVVSAGLSTVELFQERLMQLHFGMEEYWQLKVGDASYLPVLTQFENSYGLTNYGRLHLVFSPPSNSFSFHDFDSWDLRFLDEIFGTGIHHFVYD